MSHYVTWILLPATTKPEAVEGLLETALAPYSENLEVPEYDKKCHCVGWAATTASREAADRAVGTVDAIRDRFQEEPETVKAVKKQDEIQRSAGGRKPTAEERKEYGEIEAEMEAAWAVRIAPWQEAQRAALAADPNREATDAACEDCAGKGTYRSTYNPRAKWDWWVVGGRWAGEIRGIGDQMPEDKNPFIHGQAAANASDAVRRNVKNNSRIVCELPSPLPADALPHAIVTPDGEWHEEGKMGWFGTDEDAAWEDRVPALLAEHKDDLAVACDMHI